MDVNEILFGDLDADAETFAECECCGMPARHLMEYLRKNLDDLPLDVYRLAMMLGVSVLTAQSASSGTIQDEPLGPETPCLMVKYHSEQMAKRCAEGINSLIEVVEPYRQRKASRYYKHPHTPGEN